MNKNVSTQQIVTSIFVLIWIFIINLASPMITTTSPWPMFFVAICIALVGDVKKVYLSGLVGILLLGGLNFLLVAVAPIIGETAAVIILTFIVLAIIIVGENWLPLCLNNITFAYIAVGTINLDIIGESFVGWLLMFVIGGAIIFIGILLINILSGKLFANKDSK